ncbi:MAG: hypothetical protein ABFD63_10085 [Smithella sp.]
MSSLNTNTYPAGSRAGAGAIVIHEGKILPVKRGVEPGKGLWAIPGGTLRLGRMVCPRRYGWFAGFTKYDQGSVLAGFLELNKDSIRRTA